MSRTLARAARRLWWSLFGAAATAAVALVLLQFAGVVRAIDIQGGSMQPTLNVGTLVITTASDSAHAKVGDVISVVRDGKRVTHRVASIDKATGGLVLKGDANASPDPEAPTVGRIDMVRATIPYAGTILEFLRALVTAPLVWVGATAVTVSASWLRRTSRPRQRGTGGGRHRQAVPATRGDAVDQDAPELVPVPAGV
jgi:signal peptidase I